MKTQSKRSLFWLILLVFILTACSHGPKFSAPEIDPPSDLIPSYVPEGFELVSGFKIDPADFKVRFDADNGEQRVPWEPELVGHYTSIFSPAGNEALGVYYQSKDQIILITKSYFPDGSLELWRTNYEKITAQDCDCDCCCPQIGLAIGIPLPLRAAEIQEERTINGTTVAILKSLGGWITVFVRGDYLLAVDSSISIEENLKIVSSLLNQ
jgi:hypothetical protein